MNDGGTDRIYKTFTKERLTRCASELTPENQVDQTYTRIPSPLYNLSNTKIEKLWPLNRVIPIF